MARSEITLTSTWQQVATGLAVFTVKTINRQSNAQRQVSFNESASDTAAMDLVAEDNLQVEQRDDVVTYAKGAGILLIVDED